MEQENNWKKRITFNEENQRLEFDGVQINDSEDLEYVFRTIQSIKGER